MSDGRIIVTLVRCSTVLLEFDGFRVLTDPWFTNHMRFLPCFKAPGMLPHELGPLDAVLVSHLHADHFDKKSVLQMGPAPLPVLGPPGMIRVLRTLHGTRLVEMPPGSSWVQKGVTIHSVPGPHTLPGPEEINFVIEFPDFGRVFFGGDARLDREVMRDIAARFAPVKLALLPVGGTRIFGKRTVMGPMDALESATRLQAETVIPIHEGGIWMSLPPASMHPGRAEHLRRLTDGRSYTPNVIVLEEGERWRGGC